MCIRDSCWTVWIIIHAHLILVKVAILGMYVLLNMALAIITTRDISTLFQSLPRDLLQTKQSSDNLVLKSK